MENPGLSPDAQNDEFAYICASYSKPAVMNKDEKRSSCITVQSYDVAVSNYYMSISSDYSESLFDDTTDDCSVPKDALKSFKKHQTAVQLYIKPAREMKALLVQLKKHEVKSIKKVDIRYISVTNYCLIEN